MKKEQTHPVKVPPREQAVPGWLWVMVMLLPALAGWSILFGPYSSRAKGIAGAAMIAETALTLYGISGDLMQLKALLSYL